MASSPPNQNNNTTNPPLSQRSAPSPRAERSSHSNRRHNERNTEENHKEQLETARRRHKHIYDLALLTLDTYNLEQLKAENEVIEQRVLQAEKTAEEARRRRELAERDAAAQARKAEELRVQAVVDAKKAKDLQEQAAAAASSQASQASATVASLQLQASRTPTPAQPVSTPPLSDTLTPAPAARAPEPAQPVSQAPVQASPSIQQTAPSVPKPTASLPQIQTSQPPPTPKGRAPNPYLCPDEARLVTIHQNCKKMRAYMKSLGEQDGRIKKEAGRMRRLVRMSIGQLTGGETDQKANAIQLNKVVLTLKDALTNQTCPTPMMNMDDFVVGQREPLQGAANNDQLPVMFVFLLNHFAKAVVAQLALEAGSKPLNALSVGIFAVRIFALPEYLWRGKSLIDILIAKFRIVCPTLFGIRENDDTNEGRQNIGWKKTPSGDWVAEELHVLRVTGIAAGYAAICLRDFSKSARLVHPYGVWHYWKAVVGIVATPSEEFTNTQGYVLKSLIDHYEKKFVGFYGSAAIAVLQQATIQLPARMKKPNNGSIAVGALALKMQHELGIDVRQILRA